MTTEKIIELNQKLLKNVEYQLAEFIMTRDFNKDALEKNPTLKEKILPLILTVESDIKQTFEYQEFIQNRLKELNKRKPGDIIIILEDKQNEKA